MINKSRIRINLMMGLFISTLPIMSNGETVVEAHEKSSCAICVMPQQSYPLGVAYLGKTQIKQIVSAIGNGVSAKIVLTGYNPNNNNINYVYYIEHSYRSNNSLHRPPVIKELVYHNLGSGKEYLGIVIEERIYKSETSPNIKKKIIGEVKLDDTSAQFLLDLNAGSTKWNDEAGIKFKETKKAKVMVPEVYNYE